MGEKSNNSKPAAKEKPKEVTKDTAKKEEPTSAKAKTSPGKEEDKGATSPSKSKNDELKKDSSKGSSTEQLYKKGAGGLKKTEERYMTIDGTKIKYAKKPDDLKGSKGVKSIELKGATIVADKNADGKFWISIKGKNNREIATKSKDARDKWIEALTSASGGSTESKTKETAKGKDVKKDEGKKVVDPKAKEEKKTRSQITQRRS